MIREIRVYDDGCIFNYNKNLLSAETLQAWRRYIAEKKAADRIERIYGDVIPPGWRLERSVIKLVVDIVWAAGGCEDLVCTLDGIVQER